ncbi:visual pigment-like receptor peropsin [Actinia tenebrosa]|uniref:Visual pigment-like receptor peropsin n=1 Tax=Actinia tenebrosa TaxID=6105 RepID=A0A6P8IM13_ACTTE|nr:visual pigment-like receptor peropsin [Actinia tenebrosa]
MAATSENTSLTNQSSSKFQVATSELQKGVHSSILSLVLLLIIIGNTLVLLVLYRQRKQLNLRVTNMFLANLAVVDLSVGLLILPFSICTVINGGWVFGEPLCQLNGFINMTSGGTSILTMAAISIDRYLAIVSRTGRKLQVKQALVLLGVVWFWGVLTGILPVLGWNHYQYGSYGAVCKMSFDHDKGYLLFAAIVCFVVPLIIMVYCYLRVFLKVRSHRKLMQQWRSPNHINNKENKSIKSETRTAKIVVTVLFVFAGAWTPFVIVHLLQLVINLPSSLLSISTLIAGMHSFCNPIIYTAMNRKFRADLFNLLPFLRRVAQCYSLCCCCCRRPNKVNGFVMEASRSGIDGRSPLTDPVAGELMNFHQLQIFTTTGEGRKENLLGVKLGKNTETRAHSFNSVQTLEASDADLYRVM